MEYMESRICILRAHKSITVGANFYFNVVFFIIVAKGSRVLAPKFTVKKIKTIISRSLACFIVCHSYSTIIDPALAPPFHEWRVKNVF